MSSLKCAVIEKILHEILQKPAASGDPSLLCHKCSREFSSRNKLFQHIKETGHALRTTNNTSSSSAVTPTDFGKKNKKNTTSSYYNTLSVTNYDQTYNSNNIHK